MKSEVQIQTMTYIKPSARGARTVSFFVLGFIPQKDRHLEHICRS